MPQKANAGSYDKCIFSFRGNYQTIFQSDCTIVHFHEQCMGDLVSLDSCQDLMLLLFCILVVQIDV